MSRRGAIAAVVLLPALAAAQSDQPYARTEISSDDGGTLCVAWSHRDVHYEVDQAGSQRTPGNTEFAAIDAAIASWQALSDSCSDFVFSNVGPVMNPNVGQGTEDGNVITFREKSCQDAVPPTDNCLADGSCSNIYRCWDHGDLTIALTTTTYSIKTGIIYDADIELNAAPHADGSSFLFTTVDGPPCDPLAQDVTCVATDIQNTVTHEWGHAMGFDHTTFHGSIMNPTAPIGETAKRIIDVGTAEGFCSTYPKGLPPVPCDELGSLHRQIIADNKGTPGLTALGCASVPGELSLALAFLALVTGPLSRRRKREWLARKR